MNQEAHYINSTEDHESVPCEDEDDDLQNVDCVKNPCHKQFILIGNMNLSHLPVNFRHDNLLELIKITAYLTVLIQVYKTSPRRPTIWPNHNNLCSYNDEWSSRNGTGKVCKIYTHRIRSGRTCPCTKCRLSEKPSSLWWIIYVDTAAHLVYDNFEARHTTLRLFYDRNNCPEIIIDTVVKANYANIEKDFCELECVTCDKNLAMQLEKLLQQLDQVWGEIPRIFKSLRDTNKLAIVVSHPHGRHKRVSVGQWEEKIEVDARDHSMFIYTTATCPGCSGAPIYLVGYTGRGRGYEPVHSGACQRGNFSGVGFVEL